MLRVTIEVLPHGDDSKKEIIGVIEAWNVQTNPNPDRGNYKFEVRDKANEKYGTGFVIDFPRKKLTAFHLIQRALNNIFKN